MTFCEQCGGQLGASAAFCGSCGKPAGTPLAVAPAAWEGAFERASVPPLHAPAALAKLSERWLRRFAVIEKAGGERARWWKWAEWKHLGWNEKGLITSNLWAFMFGPLYYLYLGLWRKAITLTLVVMVIDIVLGMAGDALDIPLDKSLWLVSALAFKQCANIDYYRKTVLSRREWW